MQQRTQTRAQPPSPHATAMTYQGPTCTGCGGQGGYPDTTPQPGGGHVTVFRRCNACQGRGRA